MTILTALLLFANGQGWPQNERDPKGNAFFIDPSVRGAARKVLRRVMLNLAPQERENVVFVDSDDRPYANPPSLLREIDFVAQGRAALRHAQPPGDTLAERRTWMYRAMLRLHAFSDENGRRYASAWLLFPQDSARRALVIANGRVASYVYFPQTPTKQWASALVSKGAKDGLPPTGTLGRYLDFRGVWPANQAWTPPERGIGGAGLWQYDRDNPGAYALYGFAGGKVYLKSINPSGAVLPCTVADSGVLPVLKGEEEAVSSRTVQVSLLQ